MADCAQELALLLAAGRAEVEGVDRSPGAEGEGADDSNPLSSVAATRWPPGIEGGDHCTAFGLTSSLVTSGGTGVAVSRLYCADGIVDAQVDGDQEVVLHEH